MLRSAEKEELVKPESQQIASIMVEMAGTKRSNPEIEQCHMAEDSIEKLGREGAIWRGELARSQKPRQDGVGKLFARAPFAERRQRKSSSG